MTAHTKTGASHRLFRRLVASLLMVAAGVSFASDTPAPEPACPPRAPDPYFTWSSGKMQVRRRLDFGRAVVGTTKYRELKITNKSGSETLVLFVDAPAEVFDSPVSGWVWLLAPRKTIRLPITFTPDDAVKVEGAIIIESTDPKRPRITVRLMGRGERARPDARR